MSSSTGLIVEAWVLQDTSFDTSGRVGIEVTIENLGDYPGDFWVQVDLRTGPNSGYAATYAGYNQFLADSEWQITAEPWVNFGEGSPQPTWPTEPRYEGHWRAPAALVEDLQPGEIRVVRFDSGDLFGVDVLGALSGTALIDVGAWAGLVGESPADSVQSVVYEYDTIEIVVPSRPPEASFSIICPEGQIIAGTEQEIVVSLGNIGTETGDFTVSVQLESASFEAPIPIGSMDVTLGGETFLQDDLVFGFTAPEGTEGETVSVTGRITITIEGFPEATDEETCPFTIYTQIQPRPQITELACDLEPKIPGDRWEAEFRLTNPGDLTERYEIVLQVTGFPPSASSEPVLLEPRQSVLPLLWVDVDPQVMIPPSPGETDIYEVTITVWGLDHGFQTVVSCDLIYYNPMPPTIAITDISYTPIAPE